MDALKAMSLCALLLSPPNAPATCMPTYSVTPEVERWNGLIAEAAARFRIPAVWISAVMRLESAGHMVLDGRPTTSKAGAMGLMQLMPATYEDMRLRYGLGPDPYDPRNSILAGAAYLRLMFDHYGYPDLFAAYQTGPARLDAFLRDGKPLPTETISYLNSLVPGSEITWHESENSLVPTPKSSANSLFFVRAENEFSPSNQGALFVPLSDSGR
jgi:hypothetical protein